MGFFNRMRKQAAEGGAPGIDLGGGIKPPWCPFRCAHIVNQASASPIVLPNGAKGVPCQVQEVPMPCWRERCMLWDREATPPGCGLLSVMEAVLYKDEDDEDGEGVTSGPAS